MSFLGRPTLMERLLNPAVPDRGEIFSRGYKSITIPMMREVMTHYSHRFSRHWLKPVYWSHLRTLEKTMGKREIKVVSEWFESKRGRRPAFADHMHPFDKKRTESRNARQHGIKWKKERETIQSSRVFRRVRKTARRKAHIASSIAPGPPIEDSDDGMDED